MMLSFPHNFNYKNRKNNPQTFKKWVHRRVKRRQSKDYSGKRKKPGKTGSRKRRNRAVIQLFGDAACEVDGDSSTDHDENNFHINDFLEDEVLNDVKANNEPVKVPLLPFIKEAEMDDVELERMVEERYGRGSSFIRYAEDGYDGREAVDRDENLQDFRDPTLWKVKCKVGREKHSVYCLMQKHVDLQTLGTNLQIISAFSLDHVNGFIYIEAHNQQDVYEACKGFPTVYVSRVVTVPQNQRGHVLSVRSKGCGITAGMWARVKSGKYKGELAQIVAVNEGRKKATVKLIPRIDLRVLAEKFGGGVPVKRTYTAIPPRLISSSELEEYRPLIKNQRDRDTNINFEVLDGMKLKDGYLYKKISIDSLSVWGAMPTEDELLKFEPPNNNESMDLEFLTDLYGYATKENKLIMENDKGIEKGEGPSTSDMEYNFEVHDLVFFGKKDFGGMEKDNNFKILKEGTEGALVLTLPAKDLKSASFDKKLFTTLDGHKKKISINDRVRVMDGLSKDKEGVVKHIYGGIIFLFDEREEEHNGYICLKSQLCQKVISAGEASHEQGNEPGFSGLSESPPPPKTPLSTDKAWQGREKRINQEDKNAMFSVGQPLRIRMGPLKGYLCRVLAIRKSDVTVKLDSQQKILTVKSEHLSDFRGRSSTSLTGKNQESAVPFNLLGTTDSLTSVAATGAQSWGNQGGSSWKKQDGGSSWNKDGGSSLSKPASTWGQQVDAKTEEVCGRTEQKQSWSNQANSSWNKQNSGSSWREKESGFGLNNPTAGSSWGKQVNDRAGESHGAVTQYQSWGTQDGGPGWTKPAGGSSWGLQAGGKAEEPNKTTNQPPSGLKQGRGGSWNKQDGGSSWGKPPGGSGNNRSAVKPSNGSASGWEMKSKSFNNTQSSGWGNSSSGNRNAARNSIDPEKRDQNDSWGVKKAPEGGSSSGWGKGNWGNSSTNKVSLENQNSVWSSKSDWGAGKDNTGRHAQVDTISRGGRGGSWRGGRGGSSTGWGKGNWGKNVTDDSPDNQNSAWSSKSDWRAGHDYSGSHEQVDNISRGGGRGGSWRGGRGDSDSGGFGGRGGPGHGGFRGRGGSGHGGFRGRGGSGRGGFRGRGGSSGGRKGSGRGGYGGRGRSDRGGFRGRGRGRSDQGGRGRGRSDQYGGEQNNRNEIWRGF